MNISLPDAMRRWVEEQVESEGFGTASEYFRALVREAQKRKSRELLNRKLLEALDSGESAPLTAADWKHIRQTVCERLGSKTKDK